MKTLSEIDKWLTQDYDEETKETIRQMIARQDPELDSAFYTQIEFGTGGMRGVMSVGPNRMNRYTIQRATQGLANYLLKQNSSLSILIGYDSRLHSQEFAEDAAAVLAGNGIHVYLFKELRPSPLVSFGCRYKKCQAAIMITASHNPPEYNGYKVYWSDGGQVLPPHDKGIIEEVKKIENLSEIKFAPNSPLIERVLEEIDEPYLDAVATLSYLPKREGHPLKVLYTSLHGTGITILPKLFERLGFTNLIFVDKQCVPDGHFTYAPSPNPEEKEALHLGIEQMKASQADLLIANDPDADRMGAAVLHQGEAYVLNGNQIACLCLEHILTHAKNLPVNAAFIKSIATTELFRKICNDHNVACFDVLTGFKYVAEKIRDWETDGTFHYIFGCEESYGYLLGTFTHDKDGLTAAALMAEMALDAKLKGETLIDRLHAIYDKYGLYYDKLYSLKFEDTREGREKMKQGTAQLRKFPPTELAGIPVIRLDDYFPRSDMLAFWLQDGSKVIIRPSGTEPKVKIYCGVTSTPQTGMKALEQHTNQLIDALRTHF